MKCSRKTSSSRGICETSLGVGEAEATGNSESQSKV